AAGGVAAVDADGRCEGVAAVVGEGDADACGVTGLGVPRDGDAVARRGDGGAVHGTAGDAPAVLVHGRRVGPAAAGEAGHVDVAHLRRRTVAVDDDGAGSRDR